MIMSCRR